MIKIIYIEDPRRPDRNEEYKQSITESDMANLIEFDATPLSDEYLDSVVADGVICHKGMAGYNLIKKYAKKNNWLLLSYSGAVDMYAFLEQNDANPNRYNVTAEYFIQCLPEFVEICKQSKRDTG